ncbi:MAG: 2-hydroxyacid dehydrogenase [Chitinophagaceae bacterium]
MRVAVFSTKSYDREYLDRFNSGAHQLVYFETSLNNDTINLALDFEGVCVFVNDKVDRKIIEKLSQQGTGIIALRCAGYNNVDVAAAKEKNIKVTRVPAYSSQAVAEHAVALILTLNRKTHKAYNRIRESNFSLEKLMGFNLYKKTIGVIGTGKIGAAFCQIMLGFGCKVIANDIEESHTLKEKGVVYKSLDEVLKSSDIISLHCPLTPDTIHLINETTLSKIKDSAMLINTSRGGLIKTSDIIAALKSGKLGYLRIDVYEQEEKLFLKICQKVLFRMMK